MSKEMKNGKRNEKMIFEPAQSNSRLKYPDLDPKEKNDGNFLRFSIDRITFTAPFLAEDFEKLFPRFLRKEFIQSCGSGFQVLDLSHCFVDDFGNHHAELPPVQVAYVEMVKYQENRIRIDFNPNHGMESEGGIWLKNFMSKIRQKKFSRADVACDIFNHDEIKDYEVWKFGVTKKYFIGRSGEVETKYFGSSGSRKQIRLYNKKVEQENRHGKIVNLNSWWRLELQLRGKEVEQYPKIVKEMLENFYDPDFLSPNLTESEQNKIARLKIDKGYYGSLPKTSKQRLRKIIQKAKPKNSLSVEIAKKFKEELPILENELADYLGRYKVKSATVSDAK